jgi:hypothetical protein
VEEASEPLLVMQTPHRSKGGKKPRIITIPNDSTSESEELVYVVDSKKRQERQEQVYLIRSDEKRRRKNDEFVMKGSNVMYLNERKKKAIVLPERRQKEYIVVSDTPEKPDSPH